MTTARAPISRATSRRVAALHRQGDKWRLVIAERGAGAGSGPVRIVESLTVPAGDAGAVIEAVTRLKAERLVRVLPASAFVSRVIEVPDAPEAELASSLQLLAEAHLPAGLPAHRRGSGVIPGPASEGSRAAMVLGWADTAGGATPAGGGAAEPPIMPEIESCTSELVALTGLVEPRQSTLAVYADRDSGSVAMLAWNGTRSSVRALREHAEDEGGWSDAVTVLVRETADRFGIESADTGARIESPRALWMDESTRARAGRGLGGGRASDLNWQREYGVAAGAAAMALLAGPATAPLLALTANPPVVRLSPVERLVAWVNAPGRATTLLVIAVGVLLLVPLGTAWARRAALQSKARAIEAQQKGADPEELDQRLALYRELDKRRLPMVKLLSDLAGCMPEGITLDSVQMIAADKRLTLRGKAASFADITTFTSKLNASGVFADCLAGRNEEKDDGVEFDLQGVIKNPHVEAKGVEDWAKTPLAVKLYGEEARKAQPEEETSKGEKKAAPTRDRNRRPGGGGPGGAGDSASSVKPAEPVPPPLTDAQIKALDFSKAGTEFGQRRKAASRADIDAATKQRLKEEIEKIKARLEEAKASMRSGAASAPAETKGGGAK